MQKKIQVIIALCSTAIFTGCGYQKEIETQKKKITSLEESVLTLLSDLDKKEKLLSIALQEKRTTEDKMRKDSEKLIAEVRERILAIESTNADAVKMENTAMEIEQFIQAEFEKVTEKKKSALTKLKKAREIFGAIDPGIIYKNYDEAATKLVDELYEMKLNIIKLEEENARLTILSGEKATQN